MGISPRPSVVQPENSSVRIIVLTRGQIALVSFHRYEHLNQWHWYALWVKESRGFYAVREIKNKDGSRTLIYMHRDILGIGNGDPRTVDHVKPEQTLNNTDENLRFATHTQQMHNQKICISNKSGFKGVSFHKETGKWRAAIGVNSKQIHLGLYEDIMDAARAYDAAAIKYYGEFAWLNFPEEHEN